MADSQHPDTAGHATVDINAYGLVKDFAKKVLEKGGKAGRRLFSYLYAIFFSLGTFIRNYPIIRSGTAFLAYMTRASSNIEDPRAGILSQFAIANIASATLVSSNPTNLALAGAFNIKLIVYIANMIVPAVVTAVTLFPGLLLTPLKITMHELSDAHKAKPAVNSNIPYSRGVLVEEEENLYGTEKSKSLPLEEIMNPFLDKRGAVFSGIVMAVTLGTVLTLNAASQSDHERPVFWVTLPVAFSVFVCDVVFGWLHRHETGEVSRKGWCQVIFPTATMMATHLPWALISFAFSMFILVQALVTKGWVQVFAYGWNHWVTWSGSIGAIGGMGFLSVVLCNFAGTNIGTTILLARVIQAWREIRAAGDDPISDRMFCGTVYSMALGVNYGAISTVFSTKFKASLTNLWWLEILVRKHIHVPSPQFTRVNVGIIAATMTIGCAVLIGEIYIRRGE